MHVVEPDCRVRSDHAIPTQCAGQPPDESGDHGPVRPVQTWSWVGAQDGDLVAQHEELDVLGGGRTTRQQKRPEHLPEASNRATAATRSDHVRPAITAGQRPRSDFSHPARAQDSSASCEGVLMRGTGLLLGADPPWPKIAQENLVRQLADAIRHTVHHET